MRNSLAIACLVLASSVAAAPVVVRFQSNPAGLLDQQVVVESGTTQTTPLVPFETTGLRFVSWSLGGVAQRDALGHAIAPISFTPFADTTYVAEYRDLDDDLDFDGAPDSLELFVLGTLADGVNSDPDGDGANTPIELLRGTSPRIADRVDTGGFSASAAGLANVPAMGVAEISEESNPLGLLAGRLDYVSIGSSFASSSAALELNTFRFVEWSANGTPVRDSAGRSVNQFSTQVSGDLRAVARYVGATTDVDGDGIQDWWEIEHFGSNSVGPQTDADGDGIALVDEFRYGISPLVRDQVDGGGFSIGNALVDVPAAGIAEVVESSSPPGLLSTLRSFVAPPTPYETRIAPDLLQDQRFVFWTQNGTAARDSLGIAVNPLSLTVTSDLAASATYIGATADTDADGLVDADELRFFPDLANGPQSDSDGDGVPLDREISIGTSPRIRDDVDPGGFSISAAQLALADLRPFPRIREVLVDGIPEGFFAAEPTGAAANAATSRFDANASPALGDWDGDGDLDLFAAGTQGGARILRVYRNAGSSVVPSFERVAAFESAFTGALAGNTLPAIALADVDADGRADLAVGGATGTVVVLRSTGAFSGAPTTLATIATGLVSTVPGFAQVSGDERADLVVVQPDGLARAYVHSGNNGAPYSDASMASNVLPASVAQATSISTADITEDGIADIVVSDATGSLSEFHRDAGGYQLASRIFGGTSVGYANRLSAALGDLDGDGDADVVAGFAEGGLLYLRNQVQKLTIDPTVKTLVAGQGIPFALRDPGGAQSPVGPIQWRFVSNRSGGTLDASTGAYVSGATSRRVDVIEVEDARGVTGRTYVNVIDPADQTQVGKAIIVAGGLGTSDSIWDATRTTANRTYRALLHRGYRKEDIRYFSLAYGEALETADRIAANDLDGNGIANDELFGLPLRTTLQESITQWAAGAADLVVVMVDHGVGQQFTLNGTSKLTATELDAWLDVQQAGGSDVTLVLDYCFSGSFLDALKSAPGDRIVLASASASQPAYLFDGGEVSFSQAVARGIFQGFDLETTFLQAQETMARHQAAQLDDDGSGSYQPASDGAKARLKTIGPTYAVGQDIPVIEAVDASIPSPDGRSLVRTLGAEGSSGVVSVHPLARVWCTVEAPGGANAAPQSNLPEVPLVFNRETRSYEAEIGGFVDIGNYRVSCYAKDVHASVSFPATTTVTRASAHEARLVIVVAGETTDPEWASARAIGDATFQTALARGYLASQVYYLTRGTAPLPNGCGGAACAPTQANLGTALGSWLGAGNGLPAANEVSLFLVGSGVSSGALSLGVGETLDAALLDQRLDAFQDDAGAGVVRPVNVVADHADDGCSGQGTAFNTLSPASCSAASLVRALAPQGNEALRDRAVFVSSGQGQPNVRLAGGTTSFAQLFLSHALENRSLGDATREARTTLDLVTRTTSSVQRPYVDAVAPGRTGAGVPNENGDLTALRTRFLGGLVRTTPPRTTGIASLQGPVGSPVRIYVKANSGETSRTLTAVVTPPDGAARVRAKGVPAPATITLTLDPQTQRYEGTYTPATAGEHSVLVYERRQNLLSVPDEATLTAGGSAPGVALTTGAQMVNEGASIAVTAQLGAARGERTVVPFTLTGRAGLQVDYDVDALGFVFAPGETTKSITLTALDENVMEADELLVLALGEADGVTVSPPAEVRITIVNVGGVPPPEIFEDGFE